VKVKTHHYEYDIVFAPKTSPYWTSLPPGVTETDSGYSDHDHELIVIRDDLADAMKADTVLHEVLHVAMLAGGGTEDAKMTEEEWVGVTTAGLKQMLVLDNDELFEYLGVNL
jgi:hypothetical protein